MVVSDEIPRAPRSELSQLVIVLVRVNVSALMVSRLAKTVATSRFVSLVVGSAETAVTRTTMVAKLNIFFFSLSVKLF